MKTRLRNRTGISRSGLQKIERIAAQGSRAIRRSFVAAVRPPSIYTDRRSITIEEGRNFHAQ